MKQLTTFRLSQHAILVLSMLEKTLHTSKTAVLEQSLEFFAEKKLKSHHVMMSYAGLLSEKKADHIIKTIRRSRKNKRIRITV